MKRRFSNGNHQGVEYHLNLPGHPGTKTLRRVRQSMRVMTSWDSATSSKLFCLGSMMLHSSSQNPSRKTTTEPMWYVYYRYPNLQDLRTKEKASLYCYHTTTSTLLLFEAPFFSLNPPKKHVSSRLPHLRSRSPVQRAILQVRLHGHEVVRRRARRGHAGVFSRHGSASNGRVRSDGQTRRGRFGAEVWKCGTSTGS